MKKPKMMPVDLDLSLPGARLIIWHATETEDELIRSVTAEDAEYAKTIRNKARRLSLLSWRAALRTLIPDIKVSYDNIGAPFVETPECFISASHTGNYAAVIISDRKCAVDIELSSRDVKKVCGRFISDGERKIIGDTDPLIYLKVWCAKEAMYKESGKDGLDFLNDLVISDFTPYEGIMTGSIRGGDKLKIRFVPHPGLVVAWTMADFEQS